MINLFIAARTNPAAADSTTKFSRRSNDTGLKRDAPQSTSNPASPPRSKISSSKELRRIAATVAATLGWDEAAMEQEIETCLKR